ncbi:unnamed protein product [Eruca vesicaria subsp. sativa]|uniref:Uncharacterized protein n=1 Tax=Eruca vesicaria subsp. sativa TaxID=29727 RepID=A0ABC8J6S3_ERUVS|nr:unnamed protein product [Eruca vesicaria subsp. sativa]
MTQEDEKLISILQFLSLSPYCAVVVVDVELDGEHILAFDFVERQSGGRRKASMGGLVASTDLLSYMLAELARREKLTGIVHDEDLDIFIMKSLALGGQETSLIGEYIMKILGLDTCSDTLVGDEMIKGISGGQKKRLTTGELLVVPARVVFMDEISNGLDSPTTHHNYHVYEAYNSRAGRNHSHFFTPTFSRDLRVIRRSALREKMWQISCKSYVPPGKFAEAFRSYPTGKKVAKKLDVQFDKRFNHSAALSTSQYGVKRSELLNINFSWQKQLMKKNAFIYVFKFVQLLLVAMITMTVFCRTTMHHNTIDDGNIYLGSLYFSMVIILFNGFT